MFITQYWQNALYSILAKHLNIGGNTYCLAINNNDTSPIYVLVGDIRREIETVNNLFTERKELHKSI